MLLKSYNKYRKVFHGKIRNNAEIKRDTLYNCYDCGNSKSVSTKENRCVEIFLDTGDCTFEVFME